MQLAAVGLVGGSGYSGLEMARLLALHPKFGLSFVASDRFQGEPLSQRLGVAGAAGRLRFIPLAQIEAAAAGCAAVVLATPAEVSARLAPRLLDRGLRVVDLSGAFRLRSAQSYPCHYGFVHPTPNLLSKALYGLPELGSRADLGTSLVANPGCYATAAALALGPLLQGNLIEPGSLIVDAASGVTGAGRNASEELSFAEVADDFRAYKVLSHQHTPEMLQTLQALAPAAELQLTFTPHLLPVRRGILATVYARLRVGASPQAPLEALQQAYAAAAFVRVLPTPEAVSLRQVTFTNRCDLSARSDGRMVVVVAALDNLLKGAAGQALQNLNAMFGCEETLGLEHLLGAPA